MIHEFTVLNQQIENHKAKFYEVAPDPDCNKDPQGQQEYEQRSFPVKCKICTATAFDSEKSLRELGWSLTWKHGELCPKHNEENKYK